MWINISYLDHDTSAPLLQQAPEQFAQTEVRQFRCMHYYTPHGIYSYHK